VRDRGHLASGSLRPYLLPVIKAMLEGFPFTISGSMPTRAQSTTARSPAGWNRIEFTKSRPRHSNDNGLAETKNGAVLRKSFGDSHPRSVMQGKSMPSAPHAYLTPPSTSTDPACSPRTPSILGQVEKRYNAKLCVGGMSESAYPCA